MTRHISTRERLVLSVAIAVAVSLVPLVLRFFTFLWFPGTAVGLIVFGTRILFTSFMPVRAIASAIAWSILLYFGAALWSWGQTHPTRQSRTVARYAFVFWAVLLIPWLLVAPLSGMAFDAGYTAEAYTFVWSVWTYPVTVGITAVFRRWWPWVVLLPLLNVAGCGASGLLPSNLR
jgi:hypothetical protein